MPMLTVCYDKEKLVNFIVFNVISKILNHYMKEGAYIEVLKLNIYNKVYILFSKAARNRKLIDKLYEFRYVYVRLNNYVSQ